MCIRSCERSICPLVPDFADSWRPAQDEFRDVLGQERTWDVGRHPFYELRRNQDDERVRIAFQAVPVTVRLKLPERSPFEPDTLRFFPSIPVCHLNIPGQLPLKRVMGLFHQLGLATVPARCYRYERLANI